MEYIKIYLGDFLKNAGLVGFVEFLETIEIENEYHIENDYLEIDKNFFFQNDLSKLFFEYMYKKYKFESKYSTVLIKSIENLLEVNYENETQENKKIILDSEKNLKEYFKASSIISGLKSINEYDNIINILNKYFNEKSKKHLEELLNLVNKKEIRETLVAKWVAYNIINKFWTNVSFLNTQKSAKNMVDEYNKKFIEPLIDFLNNKIKKKTPYVQCIDCKTDINTSKEATSLSFMIDMAEDTSRKVSGYWNLNPDAFLCPICTYIYSFVPFGFMKLNIMNYVFINQNMSLEELIATNNLSIYDKKSILLNLIENNSKQLENINVITRSNNYYKFKYINKNKIKFLSDKGKIFNYLYDSSKKIIKTDKNDKYFNNIADNISDLVLNNIIDERKNYNLINYLLRYQLKDDRYNTIKVSEITLILQSDLNIFNKTGGEEQMSNKVYFAKIQGYNLKKQLLMKANANEDSLRGMIYQLLNALKIEDQYKFLDIVIRAYSSTNLPIPEDLIDTLKSNDKFLDYGYAFVIGLKTTILNNKDNENNEEEK